MLMASVLLCILEGSAHWVIFDFSMKFHPWSSASSKFFVQHIVKEKKHSLVQVDKGGTKAVVYSLKITVLTFRAVNNLLDLSCSCCLDGDISFLFTDSWSQFIFTALKLDQPAENFCVQSQKHPRLSK